MTEIYCCGCERDVAARLTSGAEIYPHRIDLRTLPFWICDTCGNWVGCHHKTMRRARPLGCIPTEELKEARKRLHALIDPLWKSGKIGRRELYAAISHEIGWEYHTAQIRTIGEVQAVSKAVAKLQVAVP